jgi:phosphatidate cytidylyltransferase
MENNKNNGLHVNEISENTKKSFKTRTITALVLVAVCVPCLLFGNYAYLALIVLVSMGAIYEFIHVLKEKKIPLWIKIFTFIMSLSFIFWAFFKNWNNGEIIHDGNIIMSNIGVSTLGIAFEFLILFFASMVHENFSVSDACYYFTMSIFIGIGMQSLLFLRYVPMSGISIGGLDNAFTYNGNQILSSFLFLYVVIGAFFNDIGAYCFGVLFGKHKMNPRISPNKTWEGFFGGIIFSFIGSFLFGLILSLCGIPLLSGILDHNHWWWILLVSLVMPIVAVLGDFIFSAIKRYFGIKDYSNLLPGHGGILDRIDSLMVTSFSVTMIIIIIAYFPFVGA